MREVSVFVRFLKILFIGFVGSLFFVQLHAESLKEGEDYVLLQKPLDVPNRSVVELFSVGCMHCANMNKILPKLFAILPEDAVFLPYHLPTVTYGEQASEVLAVALILDEEKQISPKDSQSHFYRAVNAFFDANFKDRKVFTDKDSYIAYGLEAMGCSRDDFMQTLKNPKTKELLKQWQECSKLEQIRGVPSFIINGKYLILTQNVKNEEDFFYKINYLLEL